jgi:hypothetical protein
MAPPPGGDFVTEDRKRQPLEGIELVHAKWEHHREAKRQIEVERLARLELAEDGNEALLTKWRERRGSQFLTLAMARELEKLEGRFGHLGERH